MTKDAASQASIISSASRIGGRIPGMNRECGEAGAAIKLSLRSQTGEDGVRAR